MDVFRGLWGLQGVSCDIRGATGVSRGSGKVTKVLGGVTGGLHGFSRGSQGRLMKLRGESECIQVRQCIFLIS